MPQNIRQPPSNLDLATGPTPWIILLAIFVPHCRPAYIWELKQCFCARIVHSLVTPPIIAFREVGMCDVCGSRALETLFTHCTQRYDQKEVLFLFKKSLLTTASSPSPPSWWSTGYGLCSGDPETWRVWVGGSAMPRQGSALHAQACNLVVSLEGCSPPKCGWRHCVFEERNTCHLENAIRSPPGWTCSLPCVVCCDLVHEVLISNMLGRQSRSFTTDLPTTTAKVAFNSVKGAVLHCT